MSVSTQNIIKCPICQQPKPCKCASNAGGGASDNKPSLLEHLILNSYQLLKQQQLLADTSRGDSQSTIMKIEILIVDNLLKLGDPKLKLEPSLLDKLVELLEHLKAHGQHRDMLNQIEKIENKIRDYLKQHPNQMRPELSYLFDNKENAFNKKPTPFNTKPSPFPQR